MRYINPRLADKINYMQEAWIQILDKVIVYNNSQV